MKAALSVMLVSLLAAPTAFSLGQKRPENVPAQSLENQEILSPFTLRASDGSLIQLSPKTNESSQELLSYLPKEKGNNSKKCKELHLDTVSKLFKISMALIEENRTELNSDEVAVIQRTPRCEMYLSQLTSIAEHMSSDKISSSLFTMLGSVKIAKEGQQYFLSMMANTGQQAKFLVSSGVKSVREPHDLTSLVILPEKSGQNHGISVRIKEMNDSFSNPVHSEHYESCSLRRRVVKCDPKEGGESYGHHRPYQPHSQEQIENAVENYYKYGNQSEPFQPYMVDQYNYGMNHNLGENCSEEEVFVTGQKLVKTKSTAIHYEVGLNIYNSSNQIVFMSTFSDFDKEEDADSGQCMPIY